VRPWSIFLLLLAGCATGPRWYWKPAAEIGSQATRDIALWSYPDTEADIVLECDDHDLRIVFVGVVPEPPEPVLLRAASATFQGLYAVDPLEDGYGASVITVPLDHALVRAIAGGAPTLRLQWAAERSTLALGAIPRHLVRYCLALEAAG
jgi:hypothetical protein